MGGGEGQWWYQHQNFLGKRGQDQFLGGKNCHLDAEIVKFGLILTHLKLFWGKKILEVG